MASALARIGLSVLVALSGFVVPAFAQTSASSGPDLEVTGKKISKQDLGNSDPRAAFSKAEIMSVVTTGKPECKNGSISVPYMQKSGFAFDGRDLDADQLLQRLQRLKDAGKISCLHIQSFDYDRGVFDQLSEALVGPLQISLIWTEPNSKP